MSTPEDQEIWHIEVTKREKAILEVARAWIALGKLLGGIFIIGGAVYFGAVSQNNIIVGFVAGFIICSLMASAVQLFLLGLPFGLVVGTPLGAMVGVLLFVFRSSLHRLPSWWPNEWFRSAVFGAAGGIILVGGFIGWTIAERVGWWPLAAYLQALVNLKSFVLRRMAPMKESPGIDVEE